MLNYKKVYWDCCCDRVVVSDYVDVIIFDEPDMIYSGYVRMDSFGRKYFELGYECYYPEKSDLLLLRGDR